MRGESLRWAARENPHLPKVNSGFRSGARLNLHHYIQFSISVARRISSLGYSRKSSFTKSKLLIPARAPASIFTAIFSLAFRLRGESLRWAARENPHLPKVNSG
ncbi:MAG: hypothetical protein ACRC3B_19190, partial [Bacteroidia bacterium]